MLNRGEDNEKRDFSRMGIACPVTIRVAGQETLYHAVVTDLSAGGLQLNDSDAIALGSKVMVELLPEKAVVSPLKAKAEVVRCDDNGRGSYQLGLRILEMLPGL